MENIVKTIYRLSNVYRWSGLHTTADENVAEHSYNVTFLTHLLCEIRNKIFYDCIDVKMALIMAIYHDVADSNLTHITREVKNQSGSLKNELSNLHNAIRTNLYNNEKINGSIDLFDNIKEHIDQVDIIEETIEAADKIDALIKCKTEVDRGNYDFKSIYKTHYDEFKEFIEGKEYLNFFCTHYLENILNDTKMT